LGVHVPDAQSVLLPQGAPSGASGALGSRHLLPAQPPLLHWLLCEQYSYGSPTPSFGMQRCPAAPFAKSHRPVLQFELFTQNAPVGAFCGWFDVQTEFRQLRLLQ
jgi:hypothetical protein